MSYEPKTKHRKWRAGQFSPHSEWSHLDPTLMRTNRFSELRPVKPKLFGVSPGKDGRSPKTLGFYRAKPKKASVFLGGAPQSDLYASTSGRDVSLPTPHGGRSSRTRRRCAPTPRSARGARRPCLAYHFIVNSHIFEFTNILQNSGQMFAFNYFSIEILCISNVFSVFSPEKSLLPN